MTLCETLCWVQSMWKPRCERKLNSAHRRSGIHICFRDCCKSQTERASILIKSEPKEYRKATWTNRRVIERGTTCKKTKKKNKERERETAIKQREEKQNSRQKSACNPLWWRCVVSLTRLYRTPASLPSALPRKKKKKGTPITTM